MIIYIFPTPETEHRNTMKLCSSSKQRKFCLSCPLTSITRYLKYLRTLFQFLTSSCFVLEMHFVSTSPSILETPASPFNEFDQPRFKEISMQSNLEENFVLRNRAIFETCQSSKDYRAFTFLLYYNAFFIIWAYKNTRIFTCTMNFEHIAFWLMIMQNGGDMYWKFW